MLYLNGPKRVVVQVQINIFNKGFFFNMTKRKFLKMRLKNRRYVYEVLKRILKAGDAF